MALLDRRRRLQNKNADAAKRLQQVESLTRALEQRVKRLEADSAVWRRSATQLLQEPH